MARPAGFLRLAVATVLVAAAGLALPTGPAAAATCSGSDGVSVVVDFHELGGGVRSACVADGGGKSATALFTAAGFGLSYVQRQPGFVCRVEGKPASDPCVNTPPADAYWGLFSSDGRSGSWSYATTSASGLTVPEGGYVAFSWNGSSARSVPGVTPAAHAATPTKTPRPTAKPTPKPTKPSAKPTAKPTPTPTPTTQARATPTKAPSVTPSSSPSEQSSAPTPSESPSSTAPGSAGQPTKSPGGVDGEMLPESSPAAAEPAEPSDDGLPTWVGPVVIVVLFAAGAAVAVVRRRRTPAP